MNKEPTIKRGHIILARMDSSRLPGKVLMKLGDLEVLSWIIKRAEHFCNSTIVLSTSDRAIDDPLESFAKRAGINLYRGSISNVADRMLQAAKNFELTYFSRINGDSPFPPIEEIERAFVSMEEHEDVMMVSNLINRNYPYGISIETLRTDYYESCLANFNEANHLEHPTSWIYQSDEHTKSILDWPVNPVGDLQTVRMVVDTQEDLEHMRALIAKHQMDYKTPIAKILRQLNGDFSE